MQALLPRPRSVSPWPVSLCPANQASAWERRANGPRRGSAREINSWCGQCASMIEATSYAREARVYSAVLVRAAAVCMGRSQHADGAEALAIVFRCSTCENSRQRYERFPRAKTDPRRSVAPKKESLCMADRNAVAGTIDTRFFSVARSPVNCACTFAPRKRRRRGSARNFFFRFKGNCAKWASAHADGYDSASFSPTTASCSSPSRSTKMRCGHPATS